ncbi:MAG: PHP domain-containing protein [Acidobacteria bacterium]|nr:PHP domain-containing protein [Acidobacteriota bacterium]
MLRADMHVHSLHSRQNRNLAFLRSRDCYSDPEAVYRVARARGMDLVTITDHDSIDGCKAFLDRHPDAADFIVGEEVSCRMPDADLDVHIGVYGHDEALHWELQSLRANIFDVCARSRQAGVVFTLNHLWHFYQPGVPVSDYLRLLLEVPAVEVRNGAMLAAHNDLVERIAQSSTGSWAMVGGSDAHTLRRVGTTWTEAPGATREEFLESLRERRSVARGRHGGTAALAADVYGVVGRYVGSLVGRGPRDHSPIERIAFLAFSLCSVPAQFIPLLAAGLSKRGERRKIERVIEELAPWLHDQASGKRRALMAEVME